MKKQTINISIKALADKNISHLQFRMLALLYYFFQNRITDIDSNKIGEILVIHRDSVRRELNAMQNSCRDYIKFSLKRVAIGLPHKIVIEEIKFPAVKINSTTVFVGIE